METVRSDLIPDIVYTVTITSMNIYNFTDDEHGAASVSVASRTPHDDEFLPKVLVAVTRSAASVVSVQWSIQTPSAVANLYNEKASMNEVELFYRAIPSDKVPENLDSTTKFKNIKVNFNSKQFVVALNRTEHYFLVVMATISFRNAPMRIASSPMLLSSANDLSSLYASALNSRTMEMSDRYQSMKGLAVGFGVALVSLVVIGLVIGMILFIRWRRRHIDQMQHVRLQRTVSFENTSRIHHDGIDGHQADVNHETMSSPDSGTVRIQGVENKTAAFEMQTAGTN